jgi:hypothetical protein
MNPRLISKWRFPWTRSIGILLLFLMTCASGVARTYHLAKFNSSIHVDADGSARVTEEITFAFVGKFQGVYRNIPVQYPGPNGTNYSLFITVDRVTDENDAPLKYEKHTSNGYLKLKIFVPGAADANRTVNIQYTVLDAALGSSH